MKVIAGKYKGRALQSPKDPSISPTSGKVKEALFSILTEEINGARFLDIFAGSGAIGVEALSRGALFTVFIDENRDSIKTIRENIRRLGIKDNYDILAGDFESSLKRLNGDFNIIFADPPYAFKDYDLLFKSIFELKLLNEKGLLIIEHRKNIDLSQEVYGFTKVKCKRYGTASMSIYNKNLL